MENRELLSQVTFWFMVLGSFLLGIEGLEMLSQRTLNPMSFLSEGILINLKTALYVLVGLSGLHQAYFGYSSFKNLVDLQEKKDRLFE